MLIAVVVLVVLSVLGSLGQVLVFGGARPEEGQTVFLRAMHSNSPALLAD